MPQQNGKNSRTSYTLNCVLKAEHKMIGVEKSLLIAFL